MPDEIEDRFRGLRGRQHAIEILARTQRVAAAELRVSSCEVPDAAGDVAEDASNAGHGVEPAEADERQRVGMGSAVSVAMPRPAWIASAPCPSMEAARTSICRSCAG